VEHEGHRGGLGQRVAIFTAVLATVGAIVSFFGGDTQNTALLKKNDAVYERAEASDQWNFYQAKSSKQNLAELGAVLTSGEQAAKYLAEVDRYKKEKDEIKAQAEKLEAAGKDAERRSEASMHVHHRWAQAMTLIQIAIALAAITILTRNKGLMYAAYAAAGIAIGLGAMAGMHM
jgi:hypothetical protein